MNLNQKSFTIADLDEMAETFDGPEWQRRNIERIRDEERTKFTDLATEQYTATSTRTNNETAEITRVAGELEQVAEEVKQDLEDGKITPTEAAKQLAGVNRDLNLIRKQVDLAVTTEEKSWEQVDCDVDEYQQRVMARFPALAGRVRRVITDDDINYRPAPRRRASQAGVHPRAGGVVPPR